MAPTVLILGGTGFIGRNLVAHLIDNGLSDQIRVADKVLPDIAFLHPKLKKHFESPKVEFVQSNLTNAASVEKVFEPSNGKPWDYVFNLAAETKYGQSDEVYESKVYQETLIVAKEAAKRGIKVFVEASTAQVYEAGKKASKEDATLKPWTAIAKYKSKGETDIQKIPGLNLVVVRPAIVYGPGDFTGITPRLVIGAVYRLLNEEMKLLWTASLKLHTIHVEDVCRALWHVTASKDDKGGRLTAVKPNDEAEVYNLVDKNDTDQEAVNLHIRDIFGIETGFQGTMISQFAKLNLDSVTEDVNDKHLQPWSDLCKKGGINNCPLSPYLDKELLKDNSLSVDGSKLESLGFVHKYPKMTKDLLKEVIDGFVESGIWPAGTTK